MTTRTISAPMMQRIIEIVGETLAKIEAMSPEERLRFDLSGTRGRLTFMRKFLRAASISDIEVEQRESPNARLAAAAPELLLAIRELLQVEAIPEALQMARHQIDAAHAAIAKATEGV